MFAPSGHSDTLRLGPHRASRKLASMSQPSKMQWTVRNSSWTIQPDHNFLTMTILLAVTATMMMEITVSFPEEATRRIENMARVEVEQVAEMISVTVGMRWKRAANTKTGRESPVVVEPVAITVCLPEPRKPPHEPDYEHQKTIQVANNRNVVLLFLRYDIYDSPIPATFLRSAPPIMAGTKFPTP